MDNLRVLRFLKSTEDFINVNYNILPLVGVKNVAWWELESTSYYENYDPVTGNGDLVVKETLTYTKSNDYVTHRLKIIERFDTDGSVWYTKKMNKYYNMAEAIEAWKKKRNFMIWELKWQVILYISETESIDMYNAELLWGQFIVPNNDNIGMYIIWVKQPLLDAVVASTLTWMDNDVWDWVTIRAYMTNHLT